jgi:UPF0716 protein FxsA
MAPVLFIALLVVPLAELWVIVQVADRVGVVSTLGLLLLVSVVGAWMLKQQGLATWRRLQAALRRGQIPTVEVADGALILFGGALLLTPGFITDALGLSLVFPPTRAAVRRGARAWMARLARRRVGLRRARVYQTAATKRDPGDASGTPPTTRPPAGEVSRGDGGGSPDRE